MVASVFARLLHAALIAGALAACSPRFDWREIRSDRWSAMFPSRPATGARTLPLLGATIELALQSSEVEDAVFAVGVADLPPALASDADRRAQVARAFEAALLRNVGGTVVREAAATLEPWDKSGVRPRPDVAREIEAQGERGDKRRRIVARFYVTSARVYEVIASVDPNVKRSEQIETFLAGFRPI